MSFLKDYITRIHYFIKGRKSAPKSIDHLLAKHGNEKIISIKVVRKPIQKTIDKALNILSFGNWQRVKSDLNYDDLFHLFLLIKTEKMTVFSIEKNSLVDVSYNNDDRNGEVRIVPRAYDINSTVRQFIERGYQADSEHFYVYNPWHYNCQNFVTTLLRSNGLLNSELSDFINQDAETIAKNLPSYLQWLGPKLTELHARFEILSGKGLRRKGRFKPVLVELV